MPPEQVRQQSGDALERECDGVIYYQRQGEVPARRGYRAEKRRRAYGVREEVGKGVANEQFQSAVPLV